MVNAYIKQPNYVNAMQQGLNTRLGYDKLKPKSTGGGRPVGSIKRGSENGPGAPFSPSRRAYEREKTLKEDLGNALLEQNKANVKKVKAEIKTNALKAALDVRKSESELKDSKIKRTAKGLQNIASFAPQLTQKNYRSMHKWIYDTANFNIPSDMFINPDEIETTTPKMAQAYFDKLGGLATPSAKMVESAIKAHEEELKADAKIAAAKLKAAALVVKDNKTIKAGIKPYKIMQNRFGDTRILMSDGNIKKIVDGKAVPVNIDDNDGQLTPYEGKPSAIEQMVINTMGIKTDESKKKFITKAPKEALKALKSFKGEELEKRKKEFKKHYGYLPRGI